VISRDQAVAEIESERQQLSALTDALPILFAIVDTEGRYEFVNRAYEKWGRMKSGLEGRRVPNMVSEDDFA
jgi:PAS domain-containing protein